MSAILPLTPRVAIPSPADVSPGNDTPVHAESTPSPTAAGHTEQSPIANDSLAPSIPEGLTAAQTAGLVGFLRNNAIESVRDRDLYGPLLQEATINPYNPMGHTNLDPSTFRLKLDDAPAPKEISEALRDYYRGQYDLSGFKQDLGSSLNEETAIFVNALPDDTAGLSDQAKYAALIQGIQTRFQQGGYVYGTDSDTGDGREYWSTPTETIADNGQGIDCEDFSFMAQHYGEAGLEELGLGGSFQVHVGLVNGESDRGHAICVYHAEDGNQYVIDGTMFSSGGGSPGKIYTIEEYTEATNFEWDTADVTAAQQAPMDMEPGFFSETMGFFSTPRPALGDLSILQLGALVLGPLSVLGDLFKLRKEHRGVARDNALTKEIKARGLQGTNRDADYRKSKRTDAGIKTILDTGRYITLWVVAAGVGITTAPLALLAFAAVRFAQQATDEEGRGAKKAGLYNARKNAATTSAPSLEKCSPAVKHLLEPRIEYKLQNSRVFGSKIFRAIKSTVLLGGFVSCMGMFTMVFFSSTLSIITPFVFGPALAVFFLAGAFSLGESMYKGFLVRKQNAAMDTSGATFIEKRLQTIRDSKSPWHRRLGASVNLAGWAVDGLEDRLKSASTPLLVLTRILCFPLYGIAWMLEGKAFNEEDLFGRLKQEFLDPNATPEEREALLTTLSAYYLLPQDELLLKWMDESDLDALGSQASNEAPSPLSIAYAAARASNDNAPQSFTSEDIESLKKDKANLIDLKRLVFGGGFVVEPVEVEEEIEGVEEDS